MSLKIRWLWKKCCWFVSTCTYFGWIPSGQTHDLKEPFELLHLCSTAVTQYFSIVLAVIWVPSLQKRSFFLGQSGRPPFLHPYDLFMFTFLLPLHLHWNKSSLNITDVTRVMINLAHLLGSAGINLDNVNWRFCLCFAVLAKASSETMRRGNMTSSQRKVILFVIITCWFHPLGTDQEPQRKTVV